jgi:uncharacterized protein
MSNANSAPKNRLQYEASLYLRQHQSNPVNWQPWDKQSLAQARLENKPIFLSIGYSSCYWCHVMEHDSFEDTDVAEILNKNFIAIKVDREERPDLDQQYMEALLMINGHGGWPMSVFLTPELKPFMAGTFYYKANFIHLLRQMHEVWQTKSSEVFSYSNQLASQLNQVMPPGRQTDESNELEEKLDAYLQLLLRAEDPRGHGFGKAPKFPAHCQLSFLALLCAVHTNVESALALACGQLDAMLKGGIFDHVEGGFHRYSVDRFWNIPHFEKMLYDNAQLLENYLKFYLLTGREEYLQASRRVIEFLQDKLISSEGQIASAIDAGPVGAEGEYYAFSYKELQSLLSSSEFQNALQLFEISKAGNFEGRTVLRLQSSVFAAEIQNPIYQKFIQRLREIRRQRKCPLIDSKMITSWASQAVSSLALAARCMSNSELYQTASGIVAAIISARDSQGELKRCLYDGQARQKACLDDYSFLIQACLDLYQVEFDVSFLELANSLQAEQDTHLWSEQISSYLYSAAKDLISVRGDYFDQVSPSGVSVTLKNLFRLQGWCFDSKRQLRIQRLADQLQVLTGQADYSSCSAVAALLFLEKYCRVVFNNYDSFSEIRHEFLKYAHVDFFRAEHMRGAQPFEKSLVSAKQGEQRVFMVCRDKTCFPPVTDVKTLRQILAAS